MTIGPSIYIYIYICGKLISRSQKKKKKRKEKNPRGRKFDKFSGVIILDRGDNVNNMDDILNDTSKFTRLDSVDKTAAPEQRIQQQLLGFYKETLIPKNIYERIRPKELGYLVFQNSINLMFF